MGVPEIRTKNWNSQPRPISSPSSAEWLIDFPSPCGAILCSQRNSPSTFYDRATSHQSVCICPCPRATRLHETPIRTPEMHGNDPHQIQKQTILGRSRRHRFQHWDGDGASPMFPHLHHENKGNKNQWHSVLQTPVYHKPTGHTWNTHHKGSIKPHKCIKRNNLKQRQDGRGAPKVQWTIHKDSHRKIRIGKGKRAMEQSSKSLQCPPSCTTSKGGRETTYLSKSTSKDADKNCGGWLSSHLNAYANCQRRDALTGDTRSTHKAKLHFAGQRRQQTKPQVPHKVTNDQYYTRGNACMHWHHQAKIQDFSSQTG